MRENQIVEYLEKQLAKMHNCDYGAEECIVLNRRFIEDILDIFEKKKALVEKAEAYAKDYESRWIDAVKNNQNIRYNAIESFIGDLKKRYKCDKGFYIVDDNDLKLLEQLTRDEWIKMRVTDDA